MSLLLIQDKIISRSVATLGDGSIHEFVLHIILEGNKDPRFAVESEAGFHTVNNPWCFTVPKDLSQYITVLMRENHVFFPHLSCKRKFGVDLLEGCLFPVFLYFFIIVYCEQQPSQPLSFFISRFLRSKM